MAADISRASRQRDAAFADEISFSSFFLHEKRAISSKIYALFSRNHHFSSTTVLRRGYFGDSIFYLSERSLYVMFMRQGTNLLRVSI